jgi:hypothetical protein
MFTYSLARLEDNAALSSFGVYVLPLSASAIPLPTESRNDFL